MGVKWLVVLQYSRFKGTVNGQKLLHYLDMQLTTNDYYQHKQPVIKYIHEI